MKTFNWMFQNMKMISHSIERKQILFSFKSIKKLTFFFEILRKTIGQENQLNNKRLPIFISIDVFLIQWLKFIQKDCVFHIIKISKLLIENRRN